MMQLKKKEDMVCLYTWMAMFTGEPDNIKISTYIDQRHTYLNYIYKYLY